MKRKKLKEKKQFTEEETQIRKKYKKDLTICVIYAILIELYFAGLNCIYKSTPTGVFNVVIKSIYISFIVIAILIFEISYKKQKKNLVITGIEFIFLSIHTLLVSKNVMQASGDNQFYILATSYIWPVYYCLRAVIIYTIENRRRLKQISDIAEIVKEEKPTKKVAKKRKT